MFASRRLFQLFDGVVYVGQLEKKFKIASAANPDLAILERAAERAEYFELSYARALKPAMPCEMFQNAIEMLAKAVIHKQSREPGYEGPDIHQFNKLVELVAIRDSTMRKPSLEDCEASHLLLTCTNSVRYAKALSREKFVASCNQLEPLVDELLARL
eukprot:gnl/Spiro4/14441_TR7776_c0_g1_i1.p1 gnl/Spiro4/14441_TR7776_c0_g1~~gnl/Spiro4/14441_TR7776_c0_g1_i1.p1  ORF type:complete len:158 (+),score=27.99 gnl/Spiro4/14441_TR7776_c0_g1_i1:102-575(+)